MLSRKFLMFIPMVIAACGQSGSKESEVKVTSGFEVEEEAYPSIAYFSFEGSGLGYVCTGTFISDRYLLTAGHCTGDGQATIVRGEAAGKISRRVHIHPNWRVRSSPNSLHKNSQLRPAI
ncbi:MAG: trypsin-like serine protease [Pseudobdellovibrionaceae bacterium]|nr:trypsin-like serine protease [Pseudobdellovibrionaceae bacterium]